MNNQSKLDEMHPVDHQPNKRQKLDEDNAQMIEATKIIDLNDDCLVEIFKRLSLRDLFNVAISNGLFVEAARLVYRREFGAKLVYVSCVRAKPHPLHRDYSDTFTHIHYQIEIEDLKTCLQFVRCFGPSISEFKIFCSKRIIKWENYVDHYVNKYCANTLVNISYFNKETFSMENFQHPFIKIESVHIERSKLNRNLPSFAEWFPKLQRLELHHIRIDRRFTQASFQHLKHLSIQIRNLNLLSDVNFSDENVADILGLHPRLQSLDIWFPHGEGITLTRLMNLIRGNHSIEKLVLSNILPHYRTDASELEQFAIEHPSLVELYFRVFEISADDAIALVGQLNSLKKFFFKLLGDVDKRNYLMEHLGNDWLIQSCGFIYVELKRKD